MSGTAIPHEKSLITLSRCLKDGFLVEQGTHEELISADGEYAKLHKIQAGAFTEPPPSDASDKLEQH